jgi:hypothetical protein
MAAGSSLAVLERTERLSPELVLVDPTLAELARSQLADPDDTVARLEALARESAILAAARRLAELDSLGGQEGRSRSRNRGRHPVLAIGFATASLTMALVLGMSAGPGGAPTAIETGVEADVPAVAAPAFTPPAPAPPVAKPSKPTAKPNKPTRPRNRTPAVSRPVARPFAWAPAPGASGYHVELFRGDERVFAARTKKPAIDVPARWRFGGRSQTLSPGSYRWYVWPVVDGKRSAAATVQATLAIG